MTRLLRLSSLPLFLVLLGLVTPASAQGLSVTLTAASETVRPGDLARYTLTAANGGGSEVENVRVEILLPANITGFYSGDAVGSGLACVGNSFCSPGETIAWVVGDLAAGESRDVVYQTRIPVNAEDGAATTQLAVSADNTSDVTFSHDLSIDDGLLFQLNVAADRGPAVPGTPMTYTVTYGNVGASSPSGTVLTAELPDGAAFVGATGGGAEAGGVVTWALGTVGVGASGQVRFTVRPDAGLSPGAVLKTVATIAPGSGSAPSTQSTHRLPASEAQPLHLAYHVSQTTVGTGELVSLSLTVSNTSGADLTDVAAEVLLPAGITGFYTGDAVGAGLGCVGNSFCDPGEDMAWAVGDLAPGQSRTVHALTRVQGDAAQGEVLRSVVNVTSLSTSPQQLMRDLSVDPSPILRLTLSPDDGPAVSGETQTFTLTFGNVGSAPAPDVVLTATIPEGTALASATGGGTQSDGTVRWALGTFGPERGGRVSFTVDVPATLDPGSLLTSQARIDLDRTTEVPVRSTATVPVGTARPLQLTYTVSPTVLAPGDVIQFELTATNASGADLTDVVAEILLPASISGFYSNTAIGMGLFCVGNSFCDPGEDIAWAVGDLAPGQSRTIQFASTLRADAPEGVSLYSPAIGTATGSDEVTLYRNLFVGTEITYSTPGETGPRTGGVRVTPAPNPTAGATRFLVSQPASGRVRLAVYDALGREVAVVMDEVRPAGEHAVAWDAAALPAGVYLYRLSAGDAVRTGAVTVVR